MSTTCNRGLPGTGGNFGFILQKGQDVIASVDRVRSYPLFYYYDGEEFAVSNSARALRERYHLAEIDETSLLEFRMAGYVTGKETLYKNLIQLLVFLLWLLIFL